MNENDFTKEQLIEEINRLKIKLNEYEPESDSQELSENTEDLMSGLGIDEESFSDMFSSIMSMGGFDLQNIQFEFLNVMIGNIPNPAYCQNSEGVYLGANSFFEELVGKSIDEIKGKTVLEIAPPEIANDEYLKDKELIQNQNMMNYDMKYPAANGDIREIVISKSVFKNFDGSIAGVIGVINDITEKRRAEQALIESEKKLREANATKDKFFSIISHDMKNPFTTLLGFTEMLTDDYDEFNDEERKSFIEEMRNVSKHSYKLLENLLKWAKFQMGKLDFKPQELNISAAATEVIIGFAEEAKRKELELINNIDKEITVNADMMMMNTVIQNLFSNAIKFSNPGGKVEITGTVINNNVEIELTDNGIGIKEEDLSKLFRIDIHYVEIGSAKEKGTGLGLILCKDFIEKHGGKITIESSLGKGAKVKFSIPLN